MQDTERMQAMNELADAVECIRRAGVHLHDAGDLTGNRADIRARSMHGVLHEAEAWVVSALVSVHARRDVHVSTAGPTR